MPSMYAVQEVQVFTGSTEGPQQLGELPKLDFLSGGLARKVTFRSEEFNIDDSGRLVTGVDYSSIHRHLIWQWNGRQFIVLRVQNN
jgi:hypothetical protein